MLNIKTFYFLVIPIMILITGCNTSNDGNTVNIVTNNTSIRKQSTIEEKASSWYIRLIAEDTTNKIITRDAQLGVLDEEGATQKHTLESFPPTGSNYIDIIFQNPAGVATGEYKTYFQPFIENSEQRWQFTVKTDNSNANIALSWRGLYVLSPYIDAQDRQRYKETKLMTNPAIKNMRLVDTDTGNIMNVLSGNNAKVYYFNMNGKTAKTFEWVMVPDSALSISGVK